MSSNPLRPAGSSCPRLREMEVGIVTWDPFSLYPGGELGVSKHTPCWSFSCNLADQS